VSNRAVFQEVQDVEELGVGEAMFLALGCVRRYVVKLAESGGEGDVPGIVEVGVGELEDAVLGCWLSLCVCSGCESLANLVMASLICWETSGDMSGLKSMPWTSAAKVGCSGMISMAISSSLLCGILVF